MGETDLEPILWERRGLNDVCRACGAAREGTIDFTLKHRDRCVAARLYGLVLLERARAQHAEKLGAAWEALAREMGVHLDELDEDVPDDHPIAVAWAALRSMGVTP